MAQPENAEMSERGGETSSSVLGSSCTLAMIRCELSSSPPPLNKNLCFKDFRPVLVLQSSYRP